MSKIFTLTDFATAIPDVLQDDAEKLYPEQGADAAAYSAELTTILTPFVKRAIERYTKDRPLTVMTDSVSDGTPTIALPVAPTVEGQYTPTFDPLFSTVLSIEWPIDQQPQEFVDPDDFVLRRTPTGYTILLTADTPVLDDTLRLLWTARHPLDGSTVPCSDFLALVDLSAAFAAERLATAYTQTSDPTSGADVVNYRSKRSEYQAIAANLRKRYYNHLGVDESSDGSAEVAPAIAFGQIHEDMQSGVSRLIHTKYSR